MNNSSQASSTRVRSSFHHCHSQQQQAGTVLVFSLLMMLALTIIGISGIGNSVMEEKMVGGMRDRNNAFQAAEAALKRGQQFFTPLVGTAAFDGSAGQLGPHDADPNVWDPMSWTDLNSKSYLDPIVTVADPTSLPNVSAQPRYILKYLGDTQTNIRRSLNIGGYGEQRDGSKVSNFRVTARGVGKDSGSVVILEAYFGKRL